MKKYKKIVILGMTLGLCLSGCGQNKASSYEIKKEVQSEDTIKTETMYELKTETFTDNDVTIDYPQVINLADTSAQDKINNMIKDRAFSTYNEILKQGEPFSYELKYNVTYCSPELLSIRFNDYTNFIEAAHPSSYVETININMKDQKMIKLSDLVNINEGFVDLFKKATYQSPYPDQPQQLSETMDSFLNETDTNGWIDLLKKVDSSDINDGNQYSYLTKEGIVIVISVPHFMGDYAEFAISYKDLAEYETTDSEIWKDLQ